MLSKVFYLLEDKIALYQIETFWSLFWRIFLWLWAKSYVILKWVVFLDLLYWEKVYLVLFHPRWPIWWVLFISLCQYWGLNVLKTIFFRKYRFIFFLWKNRLVWLWLYGLRFFFFLIFPEIHFRKHVEIILIKLQRYFRKLSAIWIEKGHFLLVNVTIEINVKKIFAFQRLYKLIVIIVKCFVFGFPELCLLLVMT